MANIKQKMARAEKIGNRAEARRKLLWPEVTDDKVWNRTRSDGYSTIPRPLNLIATIADELAQKNKRVSSTYFGLWCRVWDHGIVDVENEWELATESGFSGERRVYTWRDRIKELADLGFILLAEGPKGPYQYILIVNPYHVIADLRATKRISDTRWLAINERAEDVGAKDFLEYEKRSKLLAKVRRVSGAHQKKE